MSLRGASQRFRLAPPASGHQFPFLVRPGASANRDVERLRYDEQGKYAILRLCI